MHNSVFIKRVVLKNYKSVAVCSVELGPLTFLVGPNGAGKSNFLDALRRADSFDKCYREIVRLLKTLKAGE